MLYFYRTTNICALRIDSHHHFWTIGRYAMPWMEDEALHRIRKSFTPQDLQALVNEHHVDQTVLVQTISSVDETRWFLEIADEVDFVGGVVGWVDLTDSRVGEVLDDLVQSPYLVGIRHQVHDEPDTNWLARDDVQRGLREVARRGLVYDLLIRPSHLDVSCQIAQELDELSFAVDHIAKPAISQRGWDDWAGPIEKLAQFPNVSCKISGMIEEANWSSWKPSDFAPYIEHVIQAFGTERVLFGSNWPVSDLAGTYGQVIEVVETNTTNLSEAERQRLFGENAVRLYKFGRVT